MLKNPPGPSRARHAIARGIALFLAVFTLANALGEQLHAGFDASRLLVDPRPLALVPLLALAAVALGAWSVAPTMRATRHGAGVALVVLGLCAARDAVRYGAAWSHGAIRAPLPVPFSLILLAALAFIAREVVARAPSPARRTVALSFAASTVAFALLQIALFGATDYRRPADAIVVFGARTYADGTPSPALVDRVRTACELYRAGLAHTLVVSGGPGDGPVHETEAMERLAISLGVPARDVVRDPGGLNTRDTVRDTTALFARLGVRRVLAVSYFYHLPRVKLAYARAGLDVYTVPAHQHTVLRSMPLLVAREVAALWSYWARG